MDARNAKAPPRFEVKAPKLAPNVVIVLIDDIGFGGPSTFGGPIQTPTLDRLAKAGLRFNNFHTTALCSPTRAALKCGRNHHTANTGSIMADDQTEAVGFRYPGSLQRAEGRIEKTQPLLFSADETADVGLDNQTPVAEGIGIGPEETRFTGKIHKVTIEVKAAK